MTADNKQTRSEIKRASIINAAREEFLRCGFREANMDVIAEKAAVSKRTVYNHFPSKEDLFGAIALQLLAEFRRATQIEFDPTRPAREQLLEFAEREVDLLTSDTYVRVFRLFLVESHSSPELVERILPPGTFEDNPLRGWLQDAAKAGVLAVPDAVIASVELHGMLKGALFWPAIIGYAKPMTRKERQAVIDSAVDTFLSRYNA